jgi:hypothetical protein
MILRIEERPPTACPGGLSSLERARTPFDRPSCWTRAKNDLGLRATAFSVYGCSETEHFVARSSPSVLDGAGR